MTPRRALPTVQVERSRDMAQPVDPLTTPPRPRGGWELAAHIIDHEITATDTALFAAILIGIGAPLTMFAALAALWS
jgi:hypothetical protein